jgi:hypothetical protein
MKRKFLNGGIQWMYRGESPSTTYTGIGRLCKKKKKDLKNES